MELVYEQPKILLDGAHNAASMAALIKTVGAHIPYDSMVLIFGCAVDKDIRGMLEKVDLGADKVIFTRSSTNPRAADPTDLQRMFGEVSGKMSQVAPTLKDAINIAYRAVGKGDLILIAGSFYLVGEAKTLLSALTVREGASSAG
jgi:dihydrofolate synthase/folylpolyglutamate synthase